MVEAAARARAAGDRMRAVVYLAAHQRRARWRGWAVLAALVALAGGAVLAAAGLSLITLPRLERQQNAFIHAEPCAGYLTPSRYPPGLSHRLQVVRAYGRDGRIAGGVMVNDGEHAMTVIRELLARPDVSLVHLRNVGYGCYNFAVRRG